MRWWRGLDPKTRRWIEIGGLAVLVLVIGWFIYQGINTGWTRLNQVDLSWIRFDWRFLPLSVLFLIGYYALYTVGLDVVMRDLGSPSTFPKAFKLNFASNLGKYMPGGFWPALGRAALAPMMSLSRTHAAVSMVLEAGFSSAAGIAVFLVSLGFGSIIPAQYSWWQFVLVGGLILVALHPAIFGRALAVAFKVAKAKGAPPTLSYGKSVVLFIVYVLSWLVAGLGMQFFAMTLRAGVPFNPMVFAGAYAAGSVAGLLVLFAPGGIGVREGVIAVIIAPLVGGFGPGFAIALAARLWSTGVELLLSALALAMPPRGGLTEAQTVAEADAGLAGGTDQESPPADRGSTPAE